MQAGRQGDGNAVAGQEGGRGRQPSRQRAEASSQLGMHAPAGPAPLVQTAPPASCRPRLHPRRLPDPLANLQSRCKRRSSRLKAARCKGNTCIRLHACSLIRAAHPRSSGGMLTAPRAQLARQAPQHHAAHSQVRETLCCPQQPTRAGRQPAACRGARNGSRAAHCSASQCSWAMQGLRCSGRQAGLEKPAEVAAAQRPEAGCRQRQTCLCS